MNIATSLASETYQLGPAPQAPPQLSVASKGTSGSPSLERAEEIHEAFTSFIGETFYAQMMKAMRSTVDEAAYFNGGQAEKMFRSQLDQQMAQELAVETGDRFAEPMFEQQFPGEARMLREAKLAANPNRLDQLNTLRRR